MSEQIVRFHNRVRGDLLLNKRWCADGNTQQSVAEVVREHELTV